MAYKDRHRALSIESKQLRESLAGSNVMSDQAQHILHNVQTIKRCERSIDEQKNSAIPNDKVITRCNDIIANCTASFKNALVKLGADSKCIQQAEGYLAANDIDHIQLVVLQLLMRGNPEFYARKMKTLQQRIAQRG